MFMILKNNTLNTTIYTLDQEDSFRIKIINILNAVFIFFATFYLLYFFSQKEWVSFCSISVIITFFVLSTYFNYVKKHLLSKILLIVATQLGNFVFSLYLGYGTGVHLYNLTAPLITLLIFNFQSKSKIYTPLFINLLNIIVQIYIFQNHLIAPIRLHPIFVSYFYDLNVIGTLISLTILTYYFASTNNKITSLLKIQNKSLIKTLNEKELLLAELHHRVKNNLAQISAILNLQVYNIEEPTAQTELINTQKRIKSIAQIQEFIYQNDTITSISISEQISMLLENDSKVLNINYNNNGNNINLDINIALPFHLLVHELLLYVETQISNQTEIDIQLIQKEKNIEVQFVINQKIDDLIHNSTSKDIVEALVYQLKGNLTYHLSKDKSTFSFNFQTNTTKL